MRGIKHSRSAAQAGGTQANISKKHGRRGKMSVVRVQKRRLRGQRASKTNTTLTVQANGRADENGAVSRSVRF